MLFRVKDEIADAARHAAASEWYERLARFGYAAKGVVFATIGIIASRVALGARDEDAGLPGAVEAIGDQPWSGAFLGLLAAGLFGYASWRFVQAFSDIEGVDGEGPPLLQRAVYFWIGLAYGTVGVLCIAVMRGWRSDDGDAMSGLAATVMSVPFGNWVVGLAGVIVIIYGAREIWAGLSGSYTAEFARESMSPAERWLARGIGAYGHAACGIVFATAGVFGIKSALTYDPGEARGLAETFQAVGDAPYGTAMLLAMASGFLAFGVYCWLLALHRHMPNEELAPGA